MNREASAREARIATISAGWSAVGCAGGALATAHHALGTTLADPASAVSGAFQLLAAAALARLAWLCAAAALDLRTHSPSSPRIRAGRRARDGGAASDDRMPGRARTAALFLAFGALCASAATAATASGAPPQSLTASATNSNAHAAGVLDAHQAAGHQHAIAAPDFAVGPFATAAGLARSALVAAPQPGFAADANVGADLPARCTAPVPGWTPAPGPTPAECRLLMAGGARSGDSSHVVLRGQNLWSIAASYLPTSAPAEEVAAAVEAWIEANPGLRTHPDLVTPGDVYRVPGGMTAGAR